MSTYTTDMNLALPSEASKNNGQVINANWQKINDGRTHKGTLGEAVSEFHLGALDTATGKIVKADARDYSLLNLVGFCTEGGILDEQRFFLCNGYVQNVAWALSLGPVFATDTPGVISNTPGTNRVFVGLAVTSDTVWILGMESYFLSMCCFDAVVGLNGRGNYDLPSDACDGMPIGAIIGVAPGNYIEDSDVVMKTGQVLKGLGGLYGDASPAGDDLTGVIVTMADHQLLLSNNSYVLEGITFEFTPVTDEPNVVVAGSNGYGNRVQIISGGVAVHDEMLVSGDDNRFDNFKITGQSGTDKAVHFTGYRNVFDNLLTSDGLIALYFDAGSKNKVMNSQIDIATLGATGVAGDNTHLHNVNFTGLAGTYEIDIPDGCNLWKVTQCYASEAIRVGGDDCSFDNNYFQTLNFTILAAANRTIMGKNQGIENSVPSNLGTNTASERRFTSSPTNPSVNNDDTGGYQPGSEWYNYTDGLKFLCLVATTGAAAWNLVQGMNILTMAVNHVITDGDMLLYSDLDVTTGVPAKAMTLPTLADNQGKELIISKDDAGAGQVNVECEGADTYIDGVTTKPLAAQGDNIIVKGSTNGWKFFIG